MRWMMFRRATESRRAVKPNRARPGPRWRRHGLRITAAVAFFAIALGGPAWLWRSGWLAELWRDARGSAVTASADIGLTVREVLLQGRLHAPRALVLKAVGLRVGDPIMSFDPATIRSRLEAIPWVEHAVVERRLPDTVRIRIVEREPIALWQRKGNLSLVGRDGTPIADRDLRRFRDLVVVIGRDAPKHAPGLLTMLASEPTLGKRVRAATRVGARRWNLKLDNGVDVRLPEDGAARAWRRLADLQRRHRLLDDDIEAIDMRLPDRLIVRTRNDRPVRTL